MREDISPPVAPRHTGSIKFSCMNGFGVKVAQRDDCGHEVARQAGTQAPDAVILAAAFARRIEAQEPRVGVVREHEADAAEPLAQQLFALQRVVVVPGFRLRVVAPEHTRGQ